MLLLAARQRVHYLSHAARDSAEIHQLAFEREDPSECLRIGTVQDQILDVGDFVGKPVEYRLIAIHDLIDDCIEEAIQAVYMFLFEPNSNGFD